VEVDGRRNGRWSPTNLSEKTDGVTELRQVQARCGSNEVPVTSRLLIQGYTATVRERKAPCVSEQELDKIKGFSNRSLQQLTGETRGPVPEG
jgi:hypothetical protein